MEDTADSHYSVEVAPLAARSFWRRMLFARVSLIGNAAAEAVATEQGQPAPTVFGGGSILVRDRATGKVCWQVDTTDLTGGTSPDQLLADVQHDLAMLSSTAFEQKYGIATSGTSWLRRMP